MLVSSGVGLETRIDLFSSLEIGIGEHELTYEDLRAPVQNDIWVPDNAKVAHLRPLDFREFIQKSTQNIPV
jgi:hypothetical protein